MSRSKGTTGSSRRRDRSGPSVATLLAGSLALTGAVTAIGVLSHDDRGAEVGARTTASVARPAGTASGSTPASPASAAQGGKATSNDPSDPTDPTDAAAPTSGSSGSATPAPTAPPEAVQGVVLQRKTRAELKRERVEAAARQQAKIDSRPMTVNIGSFNVLASQHTTPSGDHSSYPPASRRSVGAADLIRAHGVDILGTQETKPDQLDALRRYTGFAAFPGYEFGSRDTDNSILYDPAKWEFVSGTSFSITFMNAVRPQTVLRLRDRESGREAYFINMHASAGHGAKYAASRRAGHLRLVAEVNELKQSGLPVFVTGDMNDREEFFCRVAPATGLVAAIGGNVSGGCHPAGALAVDWVLGTGGGGVSFSKYWEDRSPMHRISDHYFVSAVATVAGDEPEKSDDSSPTDPSASSEPDPSATPTP